MSVMILRIPFPPLMPPCDWGLWSRFRRAWAIARSLCVRKPAENGNDGRKKRIMKAIIIVGIASIYSLVNGVILHENWCKARTRNKNCHLFFFLDGVSQSVWKANLAHTQRERPSEHGQVQMPRGLQWLLEGFQSCKDYNEIEEMKKKEWGLRTIYTWSEAQSRVWRDDRQVSRFGIHFGNRWLANLLYQNER